MRIGFNPNKDKLQLANEYFHQVIVPVYIPHQNDYFKESFTILKYCLESLFKTSHSKTFFTIINNGSCNEVRDYLDDLYAKSKIHELIHTTNIGKVNAILKGVSGQNFKLVTVTDADVLFLNHWQKETYAVFKAFPKAGVVSPTPSPKVLKKYNSNVIVSKIFSKHLNFQKNKNVLALKKFADSIGNSEFYNEFHLEKSLKINQKDCIAVIGAGHFVATYKSVIFNNLSAKHSPYSLGGSSEDLLLDKPVEDQGYWRLSTNDNFAYHMGNTTEDWMIKIISNLNQDTKEVGEIELYEFSNRKLTTKFKQFIVSKILIREPFWGFFLRYKGLSKEAVKKY